MAKTSRELLTEAAEIVTEALNWAAGDVTWGVEVMREKCNQWLQEELSEEGGASSSQPSEEPPTDDRWMAAYLAAQGKILEAFLPEALSLTRADTEKAREAARQLLVGECPALAKILADAALIAAREQAKESLAKS